MEPMEFFCKTQPARINKRPSSCGDRLLQYRDNCINILVSSEVRYYILALQQKKYFINKNINVESFKYIIIRSHKQVLIMSRIKLYELPWYK